MAAKQELTLAQYIGWLESLGSSLAGADWSKPIKQARLVLIGETKQNFAKQRGPDGSSWKKLGFDRVRGGTQALRDTGLLMASVTAAGREGNIDKATDASLEWGTNLVQAALHQYGGTIRPKAGKFLAIPLTIEAYRAGSARNFPKDLDPIISPTTGMGVLVEHKKRKQKPKKKKGQTIGLTLLDVVQVETDEKDVAHYALIKKSTVPARPFLGISDAIVAKLEIIVLDFAEGYLGDIGSRGHP